MPLMEKSRFTLEIGGKDFICNSQKNSRSLLTLLFY